ncbi:DUF3213 domain-containing protein [Thermococcus sp.]|uniref:DUF3213 domain-containing protein n=1 Tax=Thermococcus sp. TaxID=35749 RepID=UPI0026191AF7|nr:DUF3213 domain-containing protein [Thermococcus sp.]
MSVSPDKRLTRLEFRFKNANFENASAKQYELEKDERVWRVFINGFAKNGFVVFDEEALPREEILKTLEELEPEVVGEKSLTVEELINSSYSWNNIIGKA